jgi:hypothetical protein
MTIPGKSQLNAELTHDLQAALGLTVVNDFDNLQVVGMASIVALHIKGLGQIEYNILRPVAYHFWDIVARDLNMALELLAEIEYVDLITTSGTIKSIIPKIPDFDSVYLGIGGYLSTKSLNEKEQLTLEILSELIDKPEKRDALMGRLGAEKKLFVSCEGIVTQSGLVLPKRARGQDILVSPNYFSDNLDGLADLAAKGGAKRIEKLLKLIGESQGWPLSMIESRGEISGTKISSEELAILKSLVGDGILKPPSIRRPSSKTELFIFTPRPGKIRLNASKRNIYEKAMGLVSSMRKGQLMQERYKIKNPIALLNKLKNQKWIGANSEAAHQYKNLVNLQVGRLEKADGDKYVLRLVDTPENIKALDEAISLIQTGQMNNSSVDEDARIALTQDETYVQSLTASSDFRKINKTILGDDERSEMDQLFLDLK